jgi:hypothetical protein
MTISFWYRSNVDTFSPFQAIYTVKNLYLIGTTSNFTIKTAAPKITPERTNIKEEREKKYAKNRTLNRMNSDHLPAESANSSTE